MYNFYYNTLKKKYGNKIRLLKTDTDYFISEINTCWDYEDMNENSYQYDTTDYSQDNMYGMPFVSKKVLGTFKDVLN